LTESGKIIGFGKDVGGTISDAPEGFGFKDISSGNKHTCVINKIDEVQCWGQDNSRSVKGAPKGIKFKSISVSKISSCGLVKENGSYFRLVKNPARWHRGYKSNVLEKSPTKVVAGEIVCWGATTNDVIKHVPSGFKFLSFSIGSYHGCGIMDGSHTLKCWGSSRVNKDILERAPLSTKMTMVSVGLSMACALTRDQEVTCWGSNLENQVSNTPKRVKFSMVFVGSGHACGIVESTRAIQCWGRDTAKNRFAKGIPAGVKFSSVACGHMYNCAVVDRSEGAGLKCWGDTYQTASYQTQNEMRVPPRVKWVEENTCLTSHSEIQGPASCTSCDTSGCNKFFTIIDPKTNTGTCTEKECPTCKPKECCGLNHKHYVLNTNSLEGVCVRHNDDCTPMCVPIGNDDPRVKRVCTKGCNRIIKINKPLAVKGSSKEVDMFDIIVCQADKQIVCKPHENPKKQARCEMFGTTRAKARCPFHPDLWNLGATCITNHVDGAEAPQCHISADKTVIATIKPKCKAATKADNDKCSRLAMTF